MTGLAKIRDFVGCAYVLGGDAPARAAILWRQTRNLRTRIGLGKYHPDKVFSLRTTFGRLHFRDNFGDITNLTDLLFREVYWFPQSPGEGAILDVGANIGLAAVWFGARYPGRPVHCFEPLADNARLIKLNAPAARVNNSAVGATQGMVELVVDGDGVMASSIPYDRAAGRVKVPVVALDDYIQKLGIDRVSILKIDAEGMELDVLAGAATTLNRTHSIAMETHGEGRHSSAIRALTAAGCRIEREEFCGSTGLVFATGPLARRSQTARA